MRTAIHQGWRVFTKTLLALCFAGIISLVRADQPEIVRIDETSLDEALSEHCGFSVEHHLEATLIFSARNNSVSTTGSYKDTWKNLETGRIVVGNAPARIHQVETTSEGQIVLDIITSGPGILKSPDGGVAWIETGRFGFRVVLDATTGEFISQETIFQVGRLEETEFIDALCALLSN